MRWSLVSLALLASACAPDVERGAAPVRARVELVELEVTPESAGLDAVPLRRVAFREGAPLPDAVVSFASGWRDAAAIVDRDGRLYEVRPTGERRMLSANVGGGLAVSSDGRWLAYAVQRDVLGELRVHDGAQERTIARGLASLGALRIVDDRVLFVGGAPGGVAGVWIASVDGDARCLTNCDLRTGRPWQHRFVPLPASADALELVDDVVAWRDAYGGQHAVSLGGAR